MYLEVAEAFVVVVMAGVLRVVVRVSIMVHYFQLVLWFNFYPSFLLISLLLSAGMSYRQIQ